MLGVFADTFKTATRVETTQRRDAPKAMDRQRWLPNGHWFIENAKESYSDYV